ncbi:MAG: hypothetical protein ACRC57_04155 [Sarcina sp.]
MSKGAFKDFKFKNINFKNKVVMAPESSNAANSDGMANEFHFNHYASKALNSVGTVVVESAAVSIDGRKSQKDLGIWSDKHIKGLKQIADLINSKESVAGIQLYHSFINKKATQSDIDEIIKGFKKAAKRATKAGFTFIEINADIITELLSKDLNKRDDKYGGTFANRTRFLVEVTRNIKSVIPKKNVVAVRISSELYKFDDEKKELAKLIEILRKEGVDLINLSSENSKLVIDPNSKKELPLICGGLINPVFDDKEIISSKHGLAFLGKAILRDSYWIINGVKSFATNTALKVII